MSKRKRKQQGLLILIAALIVALLAGSAGFATGYGADAAKRNALKKEVSELKAAVSGEDAESVAAMDELKAKNEELAQTVSELEATVADLKNKNTELTEQLGQASVNTNPENNSEVLDPVTRPSEEEPSVSDDDSTARVTLVDKITKYVIIIIVVILVLMGISMLFFRREDDEDYEDEDEARIDREKEVYDDKKAETEAPLEDAVINGETEKQAEAFYDTEPEKSTEQVPEIDYDRYVPLDEEDDAATKSAKVPETLEELMGMSRSGEEHDN